MRILTKEKKYYKKLLTVALPIAMQNLINFTIALADTFMVGLMGETQLAAGNLSGKFGFVFLMFLFGITSGTNVLIAQFWGSKDHDSIHKALTIMYRVLIVGTMFFSLSAIIFPNQIMRIFTDVPEVIESGAEYLAVIGYSYIFMGISMAALNTLRPVGSVFIAVVVNITSLLVNIFFNWMLIFGNLGMPALGMRGAAIATLIARIVEVIIVAVYYLFFEKKLQYKLRFIFMRTMGMGRLFFKTAGPVIINEILWGSGAACISIIIGHMGRAFTAADSVTSIISQFVTVALWGVAHASGTIIGNAIGAGKYKQARIYANTSLFIAALMGFLSSGLVLLVRDFVISIFNLSPEAQMYSVQLVNVYAVLVIFQAISGVGLIGIIRSGGDTKFVLLVDIIFMWSICLPLGYFVSFKLAWPIAMVYLVLRCDEIFKAVAVFVRIYHGKWINDFTERAHLLKEDQPS